MTGGGKSKLNLDSVQKITYIIFIVIVLLSGFFATYTRSLLNPVKHEQKYLHKKTDQMKVQIDKLDDSVDENAHNIAIINGRIRNIK